MVGTETARRTSPLVGWAICMIAAVGMVATWAALDEACVSDPVWPDVAILSVVVVATVVALILLVQAAFWHRRRWRPLIILLALMTAGAVYASVWLWFDSFQVWIC